MIDYLKRGWAVVDLDALAHNARIIKENLSPDCKLMAVVKADAYGHGDKFVAQTMAELGADWFGVSNIEEAVLLRSYGITLPILIFGMTPPECAATLSRHNITQAVFSLDYAKQLHEAAKAANVDIDIHIKVDTGMSRLGFVLLNGFGPQAVEEIVQVHAMERFRPGGIFTHFACSDEAEEDAKAYTRMQYALLCDVTQCLEQKGIAYPLRHCCNSAGTLCYPEMQLDMVRPGIILYGLNPGSHSLGKADLRPVMSLYSTVSLVKQVPPGTALSYGRIHTTTKTTTVASVTIGYADGYPRELGNKARMLVRGQYAPVIGRVCMDQLMLDVTGIPGVAAGDTVTIVGTDGGNGLTFDEMAELCGTISYERVCLVGKRVPRIYSRGGKEIGVMDYVRMQSKEVGL